MDGKSGYTLGGYAEPFWAAKTILNESAMPFRGKNGEIAPVRLMYRADELLSVRSSHLDIVYAEGADYALHGGALFFPQGSGVAAMREDEYYLTEKLEGKSFPATEGGFIAFSEGSNFHDMQIAVTYRRSDAWEGPIPRCKAGLLPKTTERLKEKKSLKIVYYGDSITTGSNSSGIFKVPPYAPGWPDMTTGLIALRTGAKIDAVNTAVGGMTAKWGEENAYERAAAHNPDLLILAFGMNDGSGSRAASKEEFGRRTAAIIKTVRDNNPDCEVILVSSMLPNKEVAGFWNMQIEYPEALLAMEREGIAVANVTELHEYLLTKKHYFDMTGNNVNHPNDLLARLYLQTIAATLGI